MFLKFSDEAKLLVFENNLRIILSSKSGKFTNIEARKTVRNSYRKSSVSHCTAHRTYRGN